MRFDIALDAWVLDFMALAVLRVDCWILSSLERSMRFARAMARRPAV